MTELENGVVFHCSNGGTVTMIDDALRLDRFGLDESGWAYYDNFYLNPTVPVALDISNGYDVKGTVEHITGDPVMKFSLHSRQANGKADIKLTGLKPEAYYRLQFGGVLAKTDAGRAHGKTSTSGEIQFNGVRIPNE